VSQAPLPRRRRSVDHTPALVDPADIPDDARGRVELIAVRAPADVVEDTVETPPPPPEPATGLVATLLRTDAWVVAGVIMAVLLAVFIIGMVLLSR
jgi:hypothetical protein